MCGARGVCGCGRCSCVFVVKEFYLLYVELRAVEFLQASAEGKAMARAKRKTGRGRGGVLRERERE